MKTAFFDIENWKEIASTLSRNKTRTFLTGFGIFWGTAMLAILLGGSQGAKDLLMRNFDGFATNTAGFFTSTTTMPYRGNAKGRVWNLDVVDLERMRQTIPGLKAVTPMFSAYNISVKNGKNAATAAINGNDPSFASIMTPTIYAGRFINEADETNRRKVAVVGKQLVGKLYPDNPSPLGEIIEINNIAYSIVGIMGQTSEISLNGDKLDEAVAIPSSTFRQAFNRGRNIDGMLLLADDGERISNLVPAIRRLLYTRQKIHPEDESALYVFDISEQFEMVNNLFVGVSLLALFIGLSTLLAGVIGIGNIMWVIVKERTQEIGIRRAIGAKPRDIIVQILSEGMALTAVAGLAGITFATIALGVTQMVTTNEVSTPHFQMSLMQALAIVLLFGVLGTCAGIIPATKAMKIKPIEALNDK